ncbi:unnamed protein product, partial [Candidula unifasciata]
MDSRCTSCLTCYILLVFVSHAASVSTEKGDPLSWYIAHDLTGSDDLNLATRFNTQTVRNDTDIFRLPGSQRQPNLPLDVAPVAGLQIQGFPDGNSWTSRNSRWSGLSSWGQRTPSAAGWGDEILDNTPSQTRNKRKWSHFSSWGKRSLHNTFGDGTDKRWKEMPVWGKRDGADKTKKWKEMTVWGKRNDIEGIKKWKEMATWGKRNEIDNKKKWKEMTVWGKRDFIDNLKKWKEMSVWGKRNDIDNTKKWKEMSVWGKRNDVDNIKKWKEMSVWGKRNDVDNIKKWKEMSVWGKRNDVDNIQKWKEMSVWGKRNYLDNTKPWKEMSVWGKRNWDMNRSEMNLWRQNEQARLGKKWKSLSAWGKRDSMTDSDTDISSLGNRDRDHIGFVNNVSTRDPSEGTNLDKKWREMTVWGKRSIQSPEARLPTQLPLWRTLRRVRNWRDMDVWGKRPSWSKTGFTSWGKRSADFDMNPSTYFQHQLQYLTGRSLNNNTFSD